ncbi:MAG TPA: multicopper oxidase domain-containing protein, partial [Thermoanaerobaculia bacterium]|nr:multicopper oxidase domain-containing protein [Thermoanaerobaculia bacterium]
MKPTKETAMKKSPNDLTRREFVAKTVAATSAVALAGVLPPSAWAAATCDNAVETLQRIGEIVGKDGAMKGVLSIKNGLKVLPGYKGSSPPMMRYFASKDLQSGEIWPPKEQLKSVLPGPTLRVSVGQNVQLTFLNQVDVGAFPGGTLDNAETGATTGCDEATNAALVDAQGKKLPPDKDWYPETRGDSFPNCFHGSSTANLHFHGTHVTPDGFGDNVLVQVRPDPNIKEEDVQPMFEKIFAECGEHPPAWKDVLPEYREMQEKAVKNYDLHAIWKGVRGPIKDSDGNEIPALPLANQLSPKNAVSIGNGEFPQYFVGAYPNCFPVTKAEGHKMGQAPGTHWYHSHKHGSTAINLFNGLAGALIIEGDYDEDLRAAIPGLKEKVLVVQVFTTLPNLELGAMFGQGNTQGLRAIVTNGSPITKANAGNGTAQVAPTIVMQPGEVQLWRMINAQVQTTLANVAFTGLAGDKAASPMPKFRQTAQDGVQFKYFNYDTQPLTAPDADKNGTSFSISPGGRVDILVQAPMLPEGKDILCFELGGIVNLKVAGTPVTNQSFPGAENYPTFPKWLDDLPKIKSPKRELSFDWEQYRIRRGPASNDTPNQGKNKTHSIPVPLKAQAGSDGTIEVGQNRGPYYMISGKQFDEGEYDHTMQLGTPEEWTIYNTTGVAHPFHIHINPFQVVKVNDPNGKSYTADDNGIWQDVIMVPAAKKDSTGAIIVGADG